MSERLQKYMARCGVASRRKCEELISYGYVTVNGEVTTELGTKVEVGVDVVEYRGNEISLEEKKVYIMLNKPEGYITTNSDEKGRVTILDIVKVEERIYPIGRLDCETSGLLLLTNDGDLYNKVIHPRKNINKTYEAKVSGAFTEGEMEMFRGGIDIGGYITSDAEIELIEQNSTTCQVEIKIHEGKNRQVRKMCDVFNHNIMKLKRVAVGELSIGDLQKGEWRYLEQSEVDYLNSL